MSKIAFKGRRPAGGDSSFEFSEATFLKLQKDLQSGKLKSGRLFVNDNDSVGLRALIGKREISYHVQFAVRDKKTGEVEARTTMQVGSYPEDSIQDVRGRARAARDLADYGDDPRAKLRMSVYKDLDDIRATSDKRIKANRVIDDLVKAGVDIEELTARLAKELKKQR